MICTGVRRVFNPLRDFRAGRPDLRHIALATLDQVRGRGVAARERRVMPVGRIQEGIVPRRLERSSVQRLRAFRRGVNSALCCEPVGNRRFRTDDLLDISQIAGIGLNTLGAIWIGQHWATLRDRPGSWRATRW
jgi:hypothetical protein